MSHSRLDPPSSNSSAPGERELFDAAARVLRHHAARLASRIDAARSQTPQQASPA